jgi:glycerophosphoryl diester phosphodiesterase
VTGKRLRALAVAIALTAATVAAAPAPSAEAVAPNPNPWLQQRFLNMAHQGGEDEAPSNTLFALKSAINERGADTLELDVNLSSDGELMVIHDDTWTRTSCTAALCPGPDSSTETVRPASEVNDATKDQLQALDAGYWFRPNTYSHDYSQPGSAYPYRGVRTGAVEPPAGYSADDFRIPTLREVLDAFPDIPINIEIKMIKTTTGTAGGCVTQGGTQYCDDPAGSVPVADALAGLLDEPQYADRTDIIVVSFSDDLVARFHSQDEGGNVALAPAIGGVLGYVLTGLPPSPDVAAFQVPPKQNGLLDVPSLLLSFPRNAHADGYAVHVFANGDEPESEASYTRLIALGVDGYMSSQPSRLTAYLCANGIPRPDGSSHCEPLVLNPPEEPGSTAPAPTDSTAPPPPGSAPGKIGTRRCGKGKHRRNGKCVPKRRKRR